jgi:hypothetical protein
MSWQLNAGTWYAIRVICFGIQGATGIIFGGGIPGAGTTNYALSLQSSAQGPVLVATPDFQLVPVGSFYNLQVTGPPGAPIALMIDSVPTNVPLPPYGALGVIFPPGILFDGIGLGLPNSVPVPMQLDAQGTFSIGYVNVPGPLNGLTLYTQAVCVDPSFAGGIALSTHGNPALPTPACRVDL